MVTNMAMRQLQRKLVIGMIYDFVKEMSPNMLKSGVAVGFIAGFAPMFWYHKHDKKRTQKEANHKSYESVAEELKFIKSIAAELKLFAEKYELKSMNSGNYEPSNNSSTHSPEASKDNNNANNNMSPNPEPSTSSINTSNSMSLNSEPSRNSSISNPAYPEKLKNNSCSISSYPEPSNNSNSPSILYKWIFG